MIRLLLPLNMKVEEFQWKIVSSELKHRWTNKIENSEITALKVFKIGKKEHQKQ